MLLILLNMVLYFKHIVDQFELIRTQTLDSVLPVIACGNGIDMFVECVRKAELTSYL